MKTKYVCHGLIFLHVNFYDNQTMRTVILIIRGGGGEGKRAKKGLTKLVVKTNFVCLDLLRLPVMFCNNLATKLMVFLMADY